MRSLLDLSLSLADGKRGSPDLPHDAAVFALVLNQRTSELLSGRVGFTY